MLDLDLDSSIRGRMHADKVLEQAFENWLKTSGCGDIDHIRDTPARFVKALRESVAGYQQDPAEPLRKKFVNGTYNEMVMVHDIRVISRCAHHGERIIGKAHFAYLPAKHVVGLSKIPRMIRILARRLQVQEALTEQIVDVFQNTVKPVGCAVRVQAYHFCMMARGVEEACSGTITTALRGAFSTEKVVRDEFFNALPKSQIFP